MITMMAESVITYCFTQIIFFKEKLYIRTVMNWERNKPKIICFSAKAIYDNKLLECYFTRSFYKHILGIPVKYTDMESEDYSFYRGLVYLMENNINNLGCDLTFSTEINEFGVTETRDLIPDGRNIPVTEENKMDYIRRSCQMKMTGAIRQQ